MRKIDRLSRGMGIGGWLTNYKRFNVLPNDKRLIITVGDMEHFESYITERDVEYIASLGLDHIRLGFDQIVIEETPYNYREKIIDILNDFYAWCKKYGLRLVLNMHKAIGNYCDILEERGLMQDSELQDRFIAVWLKLEEVFAYDNDVVFELLNEVVNASAEDWNSLAERAIHALRKKNPTRKIIIGCTDWNNPPGLYDLKVFDDENVIYTFHCYAPTEFTHQRGVLQALPLFYNREMPYPGDAERYRDYKRVAENDSEAYAGLRVIDREFLRSYLTPAKEWIERNPDKILWCGEFGTIRHAKLEWRENYMRDLISILKEWDIPYSVWNYLSTPNDGNRFSLVDDDNRKLLSEELHRIILGDV